MICLDIVALVLHFVLIVFAHHFKHFQAHCFENTGFSVTFIFESFLTHPKGFPRSPWDDFSKHWLASVHLCFEAETIIYFLKTDLVAERLAWYSWFCNVLRLPPKKS